MIGSLDLLRLAQGVILVFGAATVYIALKGYSRRKSTSMLLLATGFAFVTIGAVTAGMLFEWAKSDIVFVEAVQALSQAIGFFFIIFSLVGTRG
jgi:branched-subunit amino acid ABC-type transport system permease component